MLKRDGNMVLIEPITIKETLKAYETDANSIWCFACAVNRTFKRLNEYTTVGYLKPHWVDAGRRRIMADIKQEHKGDDADNYGMGNSADPKNMQELTLYVQTLLQNMQDKFQTMSDQIIGRNEMGNRIDDLEKNIADLMTQAGVEGGEK